MSTSLDQLSASVQERFGEVLAILAPVTRRFDDAGFSLYLVGGVVRDLLLGSHAALDDIDLTTPAPPAEIKRLLAGITSSLWTQGERFGTIGAVVGGRDIEVTTHRAESYASDSRKPAVEFGTDIGVDLSRRDFSINAMAVCTRDEVLIDPYGGLADLGDALLRTPEDPTRSFVDDPLRMLRAARFIPRFSLTVDPALTAAATALVDRLDIVSVERIHDELEKLLAVSDPNPGFEFLRSTGLLQQVFSRAGLSDVDLGDRDPVVPSVVVTAAKSELVRVRRAALLQGLSSSQATAWLAGLRYSAKDQSETLALLDGARMLFAEGTVTDARLRHLVNRVGLPLVDGVFSLAADHWDPSDIAQDRSDIASHVALVRARLRSLGLKEDLADLSSPVGGGELITALELTPGRVVGELVKRLGEHRIENGPLDNDEAIELARTWLERS